MKTQNNQGFTLVELMVTTLLSSLIIAAVYSAYITNQKVQTAQSQVAQMQQNLRAGSEMLARDIRMAGFNPNAESGIGFTGATAAAVSFSRAEDINGDGVLAVGEIVTITYDIYTGPNGELNLGRAVGAAVHQPVAENIEAIEFRYMLDTGGSTLTPTVPAAALTAAEMAQIRAIQISILARSTFPDPEYTNATVYTSASGSIFPLGAAPPKGDFRRRLLIETIKCRNMGL
jgi:type IV pilus assembly protein PilW